MTQKLDYKVKAFYDDQLTDQDSYGASSLWSNASYDITIQAEELKKLFFDEDWVYILCDLVASEFTSSIPTVYRKTIKEGKAVYEANENHPVQAILNDPSISAIDQAGFFYTSVAEYALMGNSILVFFKESSKFALLPTEKVQIDEKTRTYKCYTEGGVVHFKWEDILHIKRPNLSTPMWGLSPFVPGKRAVLFNRYSQEYLNNFYLKGASPDIILETDVSGSYEALRELQKSFDANYSGRRNQRKTLTLPKGVTAKSHDAKIADQNIIELIRNNRETILNILRAPKHAFSLQEAGSLGSEEHKTALKYFWQATIKPIIKRYNESFTKFLKPMLGNDHIIDFDISNVEIFSEDLSKKALLAQQMLATRTMNEVRKEVWEVDPVEGGDVILSLKPAPIPEPSTFPTFSLPQQLNAGISSPTNNKVNIDIFDGFMDAKVAHYKAISDESPKIITSMKEFALDQLLLQLGIAVELLMPRKATFDKNEFKRNLNEAFDDLEEQYAKKYSSILKSTIDLGYNSQLGLIFNAEARAAIAALRAASDTGTKAILEARGIESFANISKTTSSRIVDFIAAGMQSNTPISTLINNLSDSFAQLTNKRAETIARTETLTAVSLGQWGAIKNAKRVIPKLKKVWITADDERVRGRPGGLYEDAKFDHWDLHGEAKQNFFEWAFISP